MIVHRAYMAVGTNMGDRKANCLNGIKAFVQATEADLIAQSQLYQTEPLYVEDQQWFINAVFVIQTKRPPLELFHIAKRIETEFGRDLSEQRYGPRVLDLDILLVDDMVVQTPQLIVPHPRLHERRFVLQPLSEIAPSLHHPVLNKSIQELLSNLDDGNKKVYCQ
ncbi:MAG: 2-amino-4-hydroxy-6-hydroxymethyldihydropteridine diphosphokinase [Candidatus Magnetoglobus multicellularis str. Araruama]|uniref:2-amino-4-hydroxy-6-hydroxymethyldihydropteridine pyrophosphokinase n=1 Tax=Candidatus Magnetoglobus multicellularis str. Araruama TaxID=890399 RepID=A0A1V1P577_9BACT|nr:MAG: 2-amino-4-hydroxy-6-hydroxymethyldihydropteridine diphosphokinase [Candidatus Magnetoglobus multicellularis str. Araruama]